MVSSKMDTCLRKDDDDDGFVLVLDWLQTISLIRGYKRDNFF